MITDPAKARRLLACYEALEGLAIEGIEAAADAPTTKDRYGLLSAMVTAGYMIRDALGSRHEDE